MTQLRLIDRAERDWRMQVGDIAVLNSGGPVMTVVGVLETGERVCQWEGGSGLFTSQILRPPFEMRILLGEQP